MTFKKLAQSTGKNPHFFPVADRIEGRNAINT
jgi:hypothetical protein